jgi:hypothetical protein
MTTTLKFTLGAHDTSRVILMKFWALMTVKIKTSVFWVTSCSFTGITSVSEERSQSSRYLKMEAATFRIPCCHNDRMSQS